MTAVRKRLAGEGGFTLIEVLVVLGVMGTLMGIAVPSFVGFAKYAHQTAAQLDIRQAIPSAEEYYTEVGTYTGLDLAALQNVDPGISGAVGIAWADDTSYCISADVSGEKWSARGPGSAILWYSNSTCSGTPIDLYT